MRVKWFLLGAVTASVVWYLAIAEVGRNWINALLAG